MDRRTVIKMLGGLAAAGLPLSLLERHIGDWIAAHRLARCTQLVLAGGLNTGNVAAAIAAVQPFGVDVSSGVEVRPGVKSPQQIVSFASAARAAWHAPALRAEDPA